MSLDLGPLTNHCRCFTCPACPHEGVPLVCIACEDGPEDSAECFEGCECGLCHAYRVEAPFKRTREALRARVLDLEAAMYRACNILEDESHESPQEAAWETLTEALDGGFAPHDWRQRVIHDLHPETSRARPEYVAKRQCNFVFDVNGRRCPNERNGDFATLPAIGFCVMHDGAPLRQ